MQSKPTTYNTTLPLSEPEPVEDPDYPDGGWQAWSVVVGSWCALLPTFGVMNITGILEAWLSKHQLQEYSEASVSWIFSIWYFLFYIGGVQVGPIYDTHGAKYTLLPGCIGFSVSMMMLSISHEYYQFILGYSILGGLSASAILTPALGTINHWFLRRRGLATGIASTAGGLGGIMFTSIFGKLLDQVGFPWAVRCLGFIFLACFVPAVLLLKTRLAPVKGSSVIDLQALMEVDFVLTALAISLAELALMVVITYLPLYATAHGVTKSLSYHLMTIFSACSIPGRIIPGFMSDHVGTFNTMVLCSCICTILILGLWLNADSQTAIICFTAFFGFWAGPAISLSPVCVARISKTEEYGVRYGTATLVMGLGLLVGIPVAGEILKAGGFGGLIGFGGGVYGASVLLFGLSRGVAGGWGWVSF
ncbi:monocarboxylate permease [Aspergillus avenaceus]|uniref:Monocarboxylate permease n=1 Tax=Aspergillus avenaceus TaxID=36643 RepID=A0A5N6U6F9_ASPAV|nr:monocarboxylate permease [Aspergillus avenaceus]